MDARRIKVTAGLGFRKLKVGGTKPNAPLVLLWRIGDDG